MSAPKPSKQNQPKENNIFGLSIQEIMSVGYVVLILIGMYLEYLTYIPFGINIIEHSDFADFLITPFKNIAILMVPLIGGLLIIFILGKLQKRKIQKKKIMDEENKTIENNAAKKHIQSYDSNAMIVFGILLFISINLGFGIGKYFNRYEKMKKKLDANITNAKIDFIGGESKEVYLLGKNTSNLFYFDDGNIELIVSPIQGNIKTIEYIPKDKQKQIEED